MTTLDELPTISSAPAADAPASDHGTAPRSDAPSPVAGIGAATIAATLAMVALAIADRGTSGVVFGGVQVAALTVLSGAFTRRAGARPALARAARPAAGTALFVLGLVLANSFEPAASVATVGVGWLVVSMLLDRPSPHVDTRRDRPTVAWLAGASGALAATAIVLPSLRPAATTIAAAVPAVLAVLAVALRRSSVVRDVPLVGGAFAVAVAVGAAGGIDLPDPTGGSVSVIAVVLFLTAATAVRRRRPESDSRLRSGGRWPAGPAGPAWPAGSGFALGGALLGVGMGSGVSATLAATAAALVVRPPRQTSIDLTSPVDEPLDGAGTGRAVAAATVVGLALRLATPRGLWLDELTQFSQSRLSFLEMLRVLWREDNHPPLYYTVQWVSVRVIGDSEFALRLPSILLGTLLIPLLYVTGRDLYDRRAGVAAAAFGAVAPVAVWYGQEARMYALFMVLALLGVWAMARIISGGSTRWWALLVAANTGVVLTQWFAVLHVIALNLVLVGIAWARRRGPADRRLVRPVLAAGVAQLICLAPALPLAIRQFSGNQERGLGFATDRLASGSAVVPRPGVYTLLTNLEWALFGYQSDRVTTAIVALWPVGLLLVLFMMGRARRTANRYLTVVLLVPVAGMFIASLIASDGRSLLEVRYFAGVVPVLLLLLGAALTTVMHTRRARALVGSGIIVALLAGVVGQIVEQDNPRRYGYREALAEVAARAEPGDQMLYAPFFMDVVVAYYSPALPVTSLEEEPLPDDLDGRVYVLLSPGFAQSEGSARATRSLEELRSDRRLVEVIRDPNVTVEVYGEVGS